MERCRSSVVIAAIAVCILIQTAQVISQSSCMYEYISQPPSVIECDPYAPGSVLRFNCTLTAPLTAQVTVNWYLNSNPITSSVPTTTTPANIDGLDIFTSVLLLNASIEAGNYTCQATRSGRDLLPSSTFIVSDENEAEYINFRGCEEEDMFSSVDAKCADVAITTDPITTPTTFAPSQTTPPLPTTASQYFTTNPIPVFTDDNQMIPETLQVWIYVLVAIAAVFGMIIVILSIMCVGLCLRRNKTQDSQALKRNGTGLTGSSMVSNEIYNSTENNFSAPPPDYATYSTVGNRDYEVIESFDHTQGYAHLNRRAATPPPPLPNSLPNGRSINSPLPMIETDHAPVLLPKEVVPTHHVYGELEHPSSLSCSTSPPVGVFDRADSGTHLLPFSKANGGPYRHFSTDSATPSMNESLYSPTTPLPVSAGLEDIPETGMTFSEPNDPTSFPVHEYEVIPATKNIKKYESPVPDDERNIGANPQSRVSVKSANYETDPQLNSNTYDCTRHMTSTGHMTSPELSPGLTSPGTGGSSTFDPAYSKLAYKPHPKPHPDQQFDAEFFKGASEISLRQSKLYDSDRSSREVSPSKSRGRNSSSLSPPPQLTRDNYSQLTQGVSRFPPAYVASKTTV